jgi:two-component system KDP operon response regulator KdpE
MTTQAKILLIDDDPVLLRFLADYLDSAGYISVRAETGERGLRLLFSERPVLVVVDVVMPGMDGWEVCGRIRELTDTPVIMLTGQNAEADKLRAFRLGADDYVTKPFSFAELAARIAAVLNRSERHRHDAPAAIVAAGDLVIDLDRRQATLAGRLLTLTPTEYRLLAALAQRPGEVIAEDELLRQAWGPLRRHPAGYVRRYIWFLRRKIERDPTQPEIIQTARGFGYRLAASARQPVLSPS